MMTVWQCNFTSSGNADVNRVHVSARVSSLIRALVCKRACATDEGSVIKNSMSYVLSSLKKLHRLNGQPHFSLWADAFIWRKRVEFKEFETRNSCAMGCHSLRNGYPHTK